MKKFNQKINVIFIGSLLALSAFAAGRIQNEDIKSVADIKASVLTTTGTVASGSACITSPGSLTGLVTGLFVYDVTTPGNISSGVTIAGLPGTCSAGQIQMSATAAGNGTGNILTFGGQASQTINDSKIYVTASGINEQLDQAIIDGLVGGSGGGGFNLLGSSNPGFEAGTTGWTASGGSFTIDSSTPLFGKKSALWDASALNQTLSSTAKTVVAGLYGASCLSMISYQFSGSTGDYHLQVYDGTNVLADQSLSPTTGSAVGTGYASFQCPTTGTLQTRLIAGVSNPTAIRVDGPSLNAGNVQLGSNILLSQIGQSEMYGSLNITNCAANFTRTSDTFGPLSTQTGCTYSATGNASAPATQIAAFTFANLPPGTYMAVYVGSVTNGGAFNDAGHFRFFDGTSLSVDNNRIYFGGNGSVNTMFGTFTYTNPQSNITFQVYGKNENNTVLSTQIAATVTEPGTFRLYRFPSTAQTVISGVETSSQSWSGYTSCSAAPTTTSSTFADVTPGTGCAVTQLQNDGFGSVVLGSTDASINFTPSSVGNYYVCGTVQAVTNAGDISLALTDGSNNILAAMGVLATKTATSLCSLYNVPSVGSGATAKLRMAVASGTASMNSSVSGAAGSHTIDWTIFKVSQQFPMPVYAPAGPVSEVWLNGGSGNGSTNTTVRRFTTLQLSVGTNLVATQSATLGDFVTVGKTAAYAVACSEGPPSNNAIVGITVNGTLLSTSVASATGVKHLAYFQNGFSGISEQTLHLNSGDIIRCQNDTNTDAVSTATSLRVTQLTN